MGAAVSVRMSPPKSTGSLIMTTFLLCMMLLVGTTSGHQRDFYVIKSFYSDEKCQQEHPQAKTFGISFSTITPPASSLLVGYNGTCLPFGSATSRNDIVSVLEKHNSFNVDCFPDGTAKLQRFNGTECAGPVAESTVLMEGACEGSSSRYTRTYCSPALPAGTPSLHSSFGRAGARTGATGPMGALPVIQYFEGVNEEESEIVAMGKNGNGQRNSRSNEQGAKSSEKDTRRNSKKSSKDDDDPESKTAEKDGTRDSKNNKASRNNNNKNSNSDNNNSSSSSSSDSNSNSYSYSNSYSNSNSNRNSNSNSNSNNKNDENNKNNKNNKNDNNNNNNDKDKNSNSNKPTRTRNNAKTVADPEEPQKANSAAPTDYQYRSTDTDNSAEYEYQGERFGVYNDWVDQYEERYDKSDDGCDVSENWVARMVDPRTLGCSSTVHLCSREEICSGCTCDPPWYAGAMVPWYSDGRTVKEHQSWEYTCPGCKDTRYQWYNVP